jgi:DNA repair protein RadA/Sms
VLGGGVVNGSVVLLAGDPGIGKSTLLLQAASSHAEKHGTSLYISGEESIAQLKLRAKRLGPISDRLLVAAESQVEAIAAHIEGVAPALAVVDSVQSIRCADLDSPPGSVSQVRECALRLMMSAKQKGLPVFLVGHVTKEGAVAGPRVLEHMVDTVLYLEGDPNLSYRLLRAVKNRFGSTNELGVFQMVEEGLEEVPNPSAAFLMERRRGVSGSAVVATMEGTRPLLVEVQALVSAASPYASPRRSATGLDYHRVLLVLAVLEKRVGLPLATQDLYINVPGGVRVHEPGADLGIALSVASSFKDRPLREDTVCFGEVGLTGEIRAVSMADRRVQEARRLGFQRCIFPRPVGERRKEYPDFGVVPVSELAEAMQQALVAGQ